MRMSWYLLSMVLHFLAVVLWLGHMFFWSLVVGPVTKRIDPPETGRVVRQLSLRFGGLGWPALFILVITGMIMLSYRGVTARQMASGEVFSGPSGRILTIKLILVACMILYQFFVGHRRAPRLIYVNMAVALMIVGLSILLVRAPGVFN